MPLSALALYVDRQHPRVRRAPLRRSVASASSSHSFCAAQVGRSSRLLVLFVARCCEVFKDPVICCDGHTYERGSPRACACACACAAALRCSLRRPLRRPSPAPRNLLSSRVPSGRVACEGDGGALEQLRCRLYDAALPERQYITEWLKKHGASLRVARSWLSLSHTQPAHAALRWCTAGVK